MRRLLRPAGWLYGTGVRIRNFLFDRGILPSVRFPVPVISVGNLVTGGTGKSPHVLLLIAMLHPKYKIAVLSRGYGRKTKGYRLVAETDNASESGDEPLQYKFYHPEITVAVCENRREGIKRLIEDFKPGVILLDDAFQHRYVNPGLNILLTEYDRLFTSDILLPAGNMREPASGAARADLIIVTKSPAVKDEQKQNEIRNDIRKYTGAPVMFSYMRYREPVEWNGVSTVSLKDKPVFLITGIAGPDRLLKYVRSQTPVVNQEKFRDHHEFSPGDIESLRRKFDKFAASHPGALILTTRKDAMRLNKKEFQVHLANLPVYVLDIEAVIEDQPGGFKKILIDYVESHS